ncbi:MAG TPA: hypothetical protein VFX50_06485, partial [Gemmatimonadales bacterium]|nr:hypothetical protein [Gemmatimonadales bacterium]
MRASIPLRGARAAFCGLVLGTLLGHPGAPQAQTLLDPDLTVTTVASGLAQPIALAFIGPDDLLVTEKASGQVKRVTAGAVSGVVLDLA